MKTHKQLFIRIIFLVLSAFAFFFNGCDKTDPFSSAITDVQTPATQGDLKFLSFSDTKHALNKTITASELISAQNGGEIVLEYGSPTGEFSAYTYAGSSERPKKIYRVDGAGKTGAGRMAFAAEAMALHPKTGLLYYVAKEEKNGVYRVGVWDPQTDTNTILPGGATFKPASKLAFSPDGTLYGIHAMDSRKLYTIDLTTGDWNLHRTYSFLKFLGSFRDIAFDKDGTLYNINDLNFLQIVDPNSDTITTLGSLGWEFFTGLAFANDGELYAATYDGKYYTVDKSTAKTTFQGQVNITDLNDLAAGGAEFAYLRVSLQVPPGALSNDAEITLSADTHEITGGVSVTFEPHGTEFDQPAILDIKAIGVDFNDVNTSTIDIYYENPETNALEPTLKDQINIDVGAGTIEVIDAQLNHFSRYALAHS